MNGLLKNCSYIRIVGYVILLSLHSAAGFAASDVGTVVVKDVRGVAQVIPSASHRATVLFFIQHDCPISLAYAPEMNRLCRSYSPEGFAFEIVYAEPGLSNRSAKTLAQEYAYACPVIVDSRLTLSRRVHATVVPEAIVLSRSGTVLYRGRIDNLYAAYGLRRPEATTHDLADALDSILAGKPVLHPNTPCVGCFISSIGVQ